MKIFSATSSLFLSYLLFCQAMPAAAGNNIELIQKMQQNSHGGYGKLHVTHQPASKPKTTTPPKQYYVAEISLKKPNEFDLLLTGDKNASLTVGSSKGKLIWKDSATGLSGSSSYDAAVDVAVRVLLGDGANLKQQYKFSEYSIAATKASPVTLDAVVMQPLQFGSQLKSITVWLNTGKIIGVEAHYNDGASTQAAVGKFTFEP